LKNCEKWENDVRSITGKWGNHNIMMEVQELP
jgi:hypothetical protein